MDEQRVVTVGQHLGDDADAGGHERPCRGEILEDDARHPVGLQRDVERHVERRHDGRKIIGKPGDRHPVGEPRGRLLLARRVRPRLIG